MVNLAICDFQLSLLSSMVPRYHVFFLTNLKADVKCGNILFRDIKCGDIMFRFV